MTTINPLPADPGPDVSPAPDTSLPAGNYLRPIGVVLMLELRQRLRSRGWYIMLGIWLVVTGAVTFLSWAGWNSSQNYSYIVPDQNPGPGSLIFEIVLAFVLLFALLVAPAFSANAVNGDRSAGTLAILQITLITPGQLVWGKFLASWLVSLAFLVTSAPFLLIGMLLGRMTAAHVLVALLMLAVELAVVCAIGVGISALATRPLFSIVVTYLTVAALVVGTLIAFGLGAMLAQGTIRANTPDYSYSEVYTPEEPRYTCSGDFYDLHVTRTDQVAWMLAMNPYVVVADAIPYPDRSQPNQMIGGMGFLEGISQGARWAIAGPEATTPCANGQVHPGYLRQTVPLWPLGLGLQVVIAGGLMVLGRQALRTPAHRLPRGTRVA
ncbi:ABC transporter permease [Arthrobacter sp. 35W]|uniref:ABC transporter permease n=1 Tax=Arthrobacter sp. 35W TaxID=1132441 RepID=UPI0004298CA4|nr:ABC transporter permease [Arthrobacter sp. 35W]